MIITSFDRTSSELTKKQDIPAATYGNLNDPTSI
jgi:hypothetical protein